MFCFWGMYQILPTFQFAQNNGCLCLRCFQSQISFRTDWIDILLKMLTIYLYEVGIIWERVVMALATDVDRRVILHRFWIAPRYQLPTQTSLSIAIASNSWLFSIQYLCVNLKKVWFFGLSLLVFLLRYLWRLLNLIWVLAYKDWWLSALKTG